MSKFRECQGFHAELRRRVDKFLNEDGFRENDCPQMYLKTFIILFGFASCYGLLVFAVDEWWQAVPLALLLGLFIGAIGFNVQHDGGHLAYSRHAWINKLMAMTLDLIGGSSYLWHWKHVASHHIYSNITGHDADVELGFIARITPHQKRRAIHRWQHWYLWPAYGLMTIRWQLYGDFHDYVRGKIGGKRFPRPKGLDLVVFFAGKLLFLTLAFAVPCYFHPVWQVIFYYVIISLVVGIVMSVVFQLAHCVEEASFPIPHVETGMMENAWAIHQIETTVNFSRNSAVITWLLGGLNFQVEHHLFPRICHINYPALSKVVEATCREYGVEYRAHKSFLSGVASHFRWLRRMGTATA